MSPFERVFPEGVFLTAWRVRIVDIPVPEYYF